VLATEKTKAAILDANFEVNVSDPDTTNPKDKITKIDIVKDGGVVVESFTPPPGYSVNGGRALRMPLCGGDAPNADPAKPVAWLAPVWTGR
jgi:hypothetical protein